MNLELMEQFGQNCPLEFDGILDTLGHYTVAAFNRKGSFLAVGCNDGRVFLWDFETRTTAKVIWAHVSAVTSLCWSRNGRLLASSANDSYVMLWDILTAECIIQWHFSGAVLGTAFSPRNDTILLIKRIRDPSILVQYSLDKDGIAAATSHSIVPREDDTDFDVISSFDPRGEYVYSGNARGRILVFKLKPNSTEFTNIISFRVSNTAIKEIEFAPKKKNIFMVNSADRIIRVYNTVHVLAAAQASAISSSSNQTTGRSRKVQGSLDTLVEPYQKLQDLVNRTTWKKCVFSGGTDSEFICAGSARANALYLWNREQGGLITILHGTKGEIINDVIWHPIKPVIVSIASGVVSLWTQPQVENWSAFAPDFKELEENIEYEERESEFDEADEDRTPSRVNPDADMEEDTFIDVVTPHLNDIFLSSDEEAEDPNALVYLPITVEIDDTEHDNENTADNLFEETHHKSSTKDKSKSDDAPKPLQPKNRNCPTFEL